MKTEEEPQNYRVEIEQIINILADKFKVDNGNLLHPRSQRAAVRPRRMD
jgi:chromosomal replication initiation ATPase DnaA